MKLNARQIETAKPKEKTYKLADGGGLYLEVSSRGSKYWRMKYYRPTDKKEDRLAFGVYPAVSLAGARARRDEAKKLMAQGVDPKAEKKALPRHRKSHIPLNTSPVHGMPATNAGVTDIAKQCCAALNSLFSRRLAGSILPR